MYLVFSACTPCQRIRKIRAKRPQVSNHTRCYTRHCVFQAQGRCLFYTIRRVQRKPLLSSNVRLYSQRPTEINRMLSKRITQDARIHITSTPVKDDYILRFVVCAVQTESSHVAFAWKVITEIATQLLKEIEWTPKKGERALIKYIIIW